MINDYSAKSIKPLFDTHIDKEAKIKTDQWTAYKIIAKDYHIVQEKSITGKNFKEMHIVIQQLCGIVKKLSNENQTDNEGFYQNNRLTL